MWVLLKRLTSGHTTSGVGMCENGSLILAQSFAVFFNNKQMLWEIFHCYLFYKVRQNKTEISRSSELKMHLLHKHVVGPEPQTCGLLRGLLHGLDGLS